MIRIKVFHLAAWGLFITLVLSPLVPPNTLAGEIGLIDGLWVMKKVEDRYEGDDIQEDMYLTLDGTGRRGGNPRHLDVRWLQKDYGKEDKLIIHFIAPEFAAGVTLLMEIKPYLDDDRWLYFPEANLIRRIKARDQHTNFMGTDFTYYDLSEREPDEEDHKLLRIEELDGHQCYVVETTPRKTAGEGYSKKITWVDKDRFIKLRIKYFDKSGSFQKQYDPEDWEKISGIWTARTLVMEDKMREHKTVIKRTNIRYNQGIGDDYFLSHRVDCVQYKDGTFSLLPFEERPTRVRVGQEKKPTRKRIGLPATEQNLSGQSSP